MSRDTISDTPISQTGDDPVEKTRLRREIRAKRLALPDDAARTASRRAVHQLWSLPAVRRAQSLALYLPTAGELDCTPLALQAWQRGRAVFLPVITGTTLHFAPFGPDSQLRANRFGILEPAEHARNWRTARQLDVIVAPVVAFDAEGHRLGMGGGFYDRTLAFRRIGTRSRRPHFIALAFELQRVATLPNASWDVRLDAVVTETSTYRFD